MGELFAVVELDGVTTELDIDLELLNFLDLT